jgi:para-aminobenzoate synthetase
VTPVEEFRRAAARSDRMFWLDGGGATPWSGSRSVVGVLAPGDVSLTYDASSRIVSRHVAGRVEAVGDDVFEALGEHVAKDGDDPAVSWVGYLGYACRADLPGRPATGVPDAVWMRVRDPSVIEARPEHAGPQPVAQPVPRGPQVPMTPAYAAMYEQVQQQLRLGNSYEVNLTYREGLLSEHHPVDTYLRLRTLNPAPYSGYLQHRGVHLLSSSPERYATVNRHRRVEAKPIKGTTPRAVDPVEDEQLRRHLAEDPKFRAENLMIVDLMRNDLAMVCDPGTVEVPHLMEVESYPTVHQLVSTIRGRLRDDVGTVAALRALFPAGSMTGAPKRRTMEIIDAVEATPRGVYAGAFGWISGDGRADLSVVIRSMVAVPHGQDWRYEWGTGGAVTVQSDAQEEWDETCWKTAQLRAALRT